MYVYISISSSFISNAQSSLMFIKTGDKMQGHVLGCISMDPGVWLLVPNGLCAQHPIQPCQHISCSPLTYDVTWSKASQYLTFIAVTELQSWK